MADPVVHLLVGPNGAGKSTLEELVIRPETRLEFVNADRIAAERWPGHEVEYSYEAAERAALRRNELVGERRSFVTETVFSHDSKLDLVDQMVRAGYLVTMHVVLVPEELAVARVGSRVAVGGHDVPMEKIRARYHRLWPLVAEAIPRVERSVLYDNTSARRPFRIVAEFERARLVAPPTWPTWVPEVLRQIDAP